MSTVIVTGGAGYIGSHACRALAAAGYEPVVLDNLSRGHEWAVKWGPLVRGDVRNAVQVNTVFQRYRPVGVMHFAAFIEVGQSVVDPGSYYDNNVCGSITLFNAAVANGCKNVVFSSTCAVYGQPERLPITEAESEGPQNPYGRTKLMIEHVLRDFDAAYSLRHAALRYFNAAGAEHASGIGECHDPESHLVPNAVLAALGRNQGLKVFGTDYNTPDGTAIRDYIHVSDLASAHVKALKWLMDNDASTALNLGTGTGYSVLEVIKAVERTSGREVPHEFAPRRPGDAQRLVADPTLAEKALGWKARITSIDDIVADAWRWHESGVC